MGNTELLNAQTNARETDRENSSEELIKRTNVEGTPFVIITKEGYSFGTLGKYQITKAHENEEEALQEINEEGWDFKLGVMSVMVKLTLDNLNINTK